jgi:AraC family transcriptional regulator
MDRDADHIRRFEPRAAAWRSFGWGSGVFDTAQRAYTDSVEGTIRTPYHLILVTIRGGARRLEVGTDCGHRYQGGDHAGSVSLVPAHCERWLNLSGVCSEWASIALDPRYLNEVSGSSDGTSREVAFAPFTNVEDAFLRGLVSEFARLYEADAALDPIYCDAMSFALAHYLASRYGQRSVGLTRTSLTLTPWRMRRITDYVEAHLASEIRIADLAHLVGLSEGHLHRAFRATNGTTPLEFINTRRIERALQISATENPSIAELALRVGFASPSHFTRIFRRVTGLNPSRARRG